MMLSKSLMLSSLLLLIATFTIDSLAVALQMAEHFIQFILCAINKFTACLTFQVLIIGTFGIGFPVQMFGYRDR